MKPSILRTSLAGIAGGVTFFAATFLTFVMVGSGGEQSGGPLFDPALQSPKLIAVWTEIEPLPLFATAPALVLVEYVLFFVGYAVLFRSVAPAWPAGMWPPIWRLASVSWLSCAFFEVLGPFNLLGEPLGLVALELSFWAVAALAGSAVVAAVFGQRAAPANERLLVEARRRARLETGDS